MKVDDFRTVVQNGQLAVELSCKAVIACFGEPEWIHDPSDQLLEILSLHKSEIEMSIGEDKLEGLDQMAKDIRKVAPWHGWSVYGRKKGKGWVAAVDLCTQDKAVWILDLAQRNFGIAEKFVEFWFRDI